MRHDAQRAREDAKSRQIRANLGIRWPHEIEADRLSEEARQRETARKAQAGPALGLEEVE